MNKDALNVDNYNYLINSLKQSGYTFCKYGVGRDVLKKTPCIILRHDVDFSLHTAAELAALEVQMGILSTYFVHLRSSIYNPISSDGLDNINKILSLGHDVGLHITYQDNLQELSEDVLRQLDVFRYYCPHLNSSIVSFHRPGIRAKELLDYSLPQGIIHTYQREYFADIIYFSDSGGVWKNGNPVDSVSYKTKRSMQILTHPLWWLIPGESPIQKLANFLSKNRSIEIDQIQRTIISYPIDTLQ